MQYTVIFILCIVKCLGFIWLKPNPSSKETTTIVHEKTTQTHKKLVHYIFISCLDENEDMSPLKNKQAVQEKCKFWPECKNGDSCPFYHPTVACRWFTGNNGELKEPNRQREHHKFAYYFSGQKQ